MNLVIDIGNTQTKVSTFQDREEINHHIISNSSTETLSELLKKYKLSENCIVSSTGKVDSKIKSFCKEHFRTLIFLDYQTPLPVKIDYKTPETLGIDRIAAAVGAASLFPSNNVLVIDLGTAITFDIKTEKNIFIGGNISPGLQMRFKALNRFTEHLPLIEASDEFSLVGKSTGEAILSGVQNGIIYEIDKTIETFSDMYPELKVILTGGDSQFFDNKLKKTIFVVSNLVSVGLNSILIYNV